MSIEVQVLRSVGAEDVNAINRLLSDQVAA
jgi:hypothetical protein